MFRLPICARCGMKDFVPMLEKQKGKLVHKGGPEWCITILKNEVRLLRKAVRFAKSEAP